MTESQSAAVSLKEIEMTILNEFENWLTWNQITRLETVLNNNTNEMRNYPRTMNQLYLDKFTVVLRQLKASFTSEQFLDDNYVLPLYNMLNELSVDNLMFLENAKQEEKRVVALKQLKKEVKDVSWHCFVWMVPILIIAASTMVFIWYAAGIL